MTTATETKTFSPGDRVIVARPDLLRQSLKGLETTVVTGGSKVVTIALKDGRRWPIEPKALDLLEPAPQREWQVGDRVRGEHPKTHLPCTGIFHKQGYKYMILQSPGGTTPILAETAELLTPAEDVVELPCPFTEGDLLDFRGQRWEAGRIQKTPLLTWRVELIDPEPGAGWSPEYLEWPCDEDCPAAAIAPDDAAAIADYLEQPLTEAEREILDSELERLYPEAPAIEAEIVATDPGDRLAELEADITEGLGLIEQGKAKIWAAVAAVRSEELWRVGGHPSFEAYCAERWNWKKANGHENALAGEVLEELLLSGVPVEAVPTSTSAMSQLAKAPEGDRAEVLQKAANLNGGKVTEAAVRQALKPEELEEFRCTEIYANAPLSDLERFDKTYSADTLTHNKIRGLFEFQGKQWVCTAGLFQGATPSLKATGLVPADQWEGPTYDYSTQPPGIRFTYCGNLVTHRRSKYVLTHEELHLSAREMAEPDRLPAVALGITVYRSDTSPEAIAEGLERGWLVPTAKHRPSPADSAHAAAPPAEGDQSGAEAPPPVAGDSEGVLEPGRFIRVRDRPGAWYVAQGSPADTHVMVWSGAGKYLAHPDELTPGGYCDPAQLEEVARQWLHELVAVLGPGQVRSLLGEVVS